MSRRRQSATPTRRSASRCGKNSPASPASCATTASRSGWPRRATRSRSWPAPGTRAAALKPALRAAVLRHPFDWERFDEIFDAFWLGRHMRQARLVAGGQAPAAQARAGGSARQRRRRARQVCRTAPSGAATATPMQAATAAAGARAPRAPQNSRRWTCAIIVDPADVARTHALAARSPA